MGLPRSPLLAVLLVLSILQGGAWEVEVILDPADAWERGTQVQVVLASQQAAVVTVTLDKDSSTTHDVLASNLALAVGNTTLYVALPDSGFVGPASVKAVDNVNNANTAARDILVKGPLRMLHPQTGAFLNVRESSISISWNTGFQGGFVRCYAIGGGYSQTDPLALATLRSNTAPSGEASFSWTPLQNLNHTQYTIVVESLSDSQLKAVAYNVTIGIPVEMVTPGASWIVDVQQTQAQLSFLPGTTPHDVQLDLWLAEQHIAKVATWVNPGNSQPLQPVQLSWAVPLAAVAGSGYFIRATVPDGPASNFDSSSKFRIGTSLALTQPVTGAVWRSGMQVTIRWNTGGRGGEVVLYLKRVGFAAHAITALVSNDGEYLYTVDRTGQLLQDGTPFQPWFAYTVVVEWQAPANYNGTAQLVAESNVISIYDEVKVLQPSEGDLLQWDSQSQVQWQSGGYKGQVEVWLVPKQGTATLLGTVEVTAEALSLTVPHVTSGEYTVKLQAAAGSSVPETESEAFLVVDFQSFTQPEVNAVAARGTRLDITFDCADIFGEWWLQLQKLDAGAVPGLAVFKGDIQSPVTTLQWLVPTSSDVDETSYVIAATFKDDDSIAVRYSPRFRVVPPIHASVITSNGTSQYAKPGGVLTVSWSWMSASDMTVTLKAALAPVTAYFAFDRADEYVSLPRFPMPRKDMTLALWVKLLEPASPVDIPIMSYLDRSGSEQLAVLCSGSIFSLRLFGVEQKVDATHLQSRVMAGVWQQITVTYAHSSVLELYVNGERLLRKPFLNDRSLGSGGCLMLGQFQGSPCRPRAQVSASQPSGLLGGLAFVSLWGEALDAAQARQLLDPSAVVNSGMMVLQLTQPASGGPPGSAVQWKNEAPNSGVGNGQVVGAKWAQAAQAGSDSYVIFDGRSAAQEQLVWGLPDTVPLGLYHVTLCVTSPVQLCAASSSFVVEETRDCLLSEWSMWSCDSNLKISTQTRRAIAPAILGGIPCSSYEVQREKSGCTAPEPSCLENMTQAHCPAVLGVAFLITIFVVVLVFCCCRVYGCKQRKEEGGAEQEMTPVNPGMGTLAPPM